MKCKNCKADNKSESICDAVWTFNDGGPAENNANFCPECGADLRMTEHDNSED